MTEHIAVHYQGRAVGLCGYSPETGLGSFQYSDDWIRQAIELSPLKMPLSKKVYTFPELHGNPFWGLPGMLADSLPDDFGNAVLNAWAARSGRHVESITPLERLQYTGNRGMGALEYRPAFSGSLPDTASIHIDNLLRAAQDILDHRQNFSAVTGTHADEHAMRELLSVGTSAGGARPKAVLAFNADFTEARSGQVDAPEGFTHYLLKFDGVTKNTKAQEGTEIFGDPTDMGAMEYAYYRLAIESGIEMEPCRLMDEGGRRHFLTRRFDRDGNNKIHVQTVNALDHVNFKNGSGSYSCEELINLARRLRVPIEDTFQLLKRMVFNVVARNHDDHSKNYSFMLKDGCWRLAPAYDLAYSYKPGGRWTNNHWMSINGKTEHFVLEDFYALSSIANHLTPEIIRDTVERVTDVVSCWPTIAADLDINSELIQTIDKNLRLRLLDSEPERKPKPYISSKPNSPGD